MLTRGVAVLAVMVATIGLAATASPAAAATPPLRGPVIDADWPDPEIVRDPSSGRFYSYATNSKRSGSWVNVPVRSSSDLTDWSSDEGDALPQLPAWAQRGLTWAPGVAQIDGSWRLYFTARHLPSGRQCIGAAQSSRPEGPYTAGSSPIVCQIDRGGSIDASPFQDPETGRWWLHWKSDENAPGAPGTSRLWAMELSADAMSVVGAARIILTNEGGKLLVENPSMIHAGGRYWLAYSAGWWESADYHDHVAECAGPAGPCRRIGDPYDPWLSKSSGIAGPGGAAFFTDAAGSAYVAFHGWTVAVGYADGGARAMHVEPVTFDGPGASPRLRPDADRTPTSPLPLRTTLTQEHGDVLRLYRAFFAREPDPSGARYWISVFDRGASLATIAESFTRSPEFTMQYSGTDDHEYVFEVYGNVLGRVPDAGGLAYWTSKLTRGELTRSGVVRWIAANDEFRDRHRYTELP